MAAVDWINDVLDFLAGLPLPLVLVAAGVSAFAETAIGFGLVIPGETAVTVLSTVATTPRRFVAIALVVWLSASAGDSFGYFLGHRYGDRMRESKAVARAGREEWDRTTDLLGRRGAVAVIIGRFLPVVRVLTPIAAGTSKMPFARFLAASLTGALGWSLLHVAVGAAAGASLRYVAQAVGVAGWAIVVLGVAAVVAYVVRRRRRQVRAASAYAAATSAEHAQPRPSTVVLAVTSWESTSRGCPVGCPSHPRQAPPPARGRSIPRRREPRIWVESPPE